MTDVILIYKIINTEIISLLSYTKCYLKTHTENKCMTSINKSKLF